MNREANDNSKRTTGANAARITELIDEELARAETPDLDATARAVLEQLDDEQYAEAARIGARHMVAEEAAGLRRLPMDKEGRNVR